VALRSAFADIAVSNAVVGKGVCCDFCALTGNGLCGGLITGPEESYRLWCAVVCDREASTMIRFWPNGGCCAMKIVWLKVLVKQELEAHIFLLKII